MTKISRNAPCPCGSGKKYKKCCLLRNETESLEKRKIIKQKNLKPKIEKIYVEDDGLDDLSNSVIDLINSGKFDKAEAVCKELSQRYPGQVDGIERLAMVYEARGENEKALEYYLKTVEFMRTDSNFAEEGINWALDKVKQLKDKI
ncbi:SEC-C metal-binding domain-containing protein [Desulfobacterales bacterium HSG17]|nr:SEC-C metal-binding domain-containing protein [Desulfobacterales bacterium HSG17]